MSLNITEIQQKIDRLVQSIQNQLDIEFDLFFSPEIKVVPLKRYDKDGNLAEMKLPNYAKLQSLSAPLGMVILFSGTTPPETFLACDGKEIKKADYPNLHTLALQGKTEVQPPFAAGSDEDHFKLPTLTAPAAGFLYCIKVLP